MFNILPWHTENWHHLVELFKNNRLPHAFLITGVQGLGHRELAENLAAMLLCSRRNLAGYPCGKCGDCLLLVAGNHPDLLMVTTEESSRVIKIEQIREMVGLLNNTAHRGGWRIVIIENADLLNGAAANALLKTLEEPVANVLIVLTTSHSRLIPATVRSRCQILTMSLPVYGELAPWLRSKLPNLETKLLFTLADRAPLRALAWGSGEFLAHRKALFQGLYELVLDNLCWENTLMTALFFALDELILLLMHMAFDLIKLKFSISNYLTNEDELVRLRDLAARVNLKKIFSC